MRGGRREANGRSPLAQDASFHPGRTARNHLRVLAVTGEHPAGRVGEVLSAVGLGNDADRPASRSARSAGRRR